MSARELITEHLDLWTGAVTKKSSSGRGSNGKVAHTTPVQHICDSSLFLRLMHRHRDPLQEHVVGFSPRATAFNEFINNV